MTLFGLVIAVILFIYTIQMLDSGRRTIMKLRDPVSVPEPGSVHHRSSGDGGSRRSAYGTGAVDKLTDEEKDHLPKRICPLCRSELTRDEPLYAGNTLADGRRTILIYGCRYCFRTEKSADNSNS